MKDQLKALQDMLQSQSDSVSSFDAKIASMQAAVAEMIALADAQTEQPTEVTEPTGKVYSQDEFDAGINAAVLPLQAEIGSLKQQVSDLSGGVDAKVAEATAAMKADLLAKYEAAQVAETAAETGFIEALKA